MTYRTEEPCENCPFGKSETGQILWKGLSPARRREITTKLRGPEPGHFFCHKTTRETGDGTNLLCAGALDWQHARGIESNYERICRRLEFSARPASESPAESRTTHPPRSRPT